VNNTEDNWPDDELEQLLAELEAEGWETDEGWTWETAKEELLALLDEPFRELRDNNHLRDAVLVWDTSKTPQVFEVPVLELPFVLPLGGKGTRWVVENYGQVVEAKANLLRQSKVAHELADEDPTATPQCGTVVVVVPPETSQPYRWAEVKSRVLPSNGN
jgi:hypothetical protein